MDNVYNVPAWDESELTEIASKHLNFLAFLFPFLKKEEYNREVVEIRPIGRRKDLEYVESFNVFRIDNKTLERYKEKFLKKINGKPYCLYFSSYAFDNTVEIADKKKTKINNSNAIATRILPMDYDNITVEQFKEIKKIFNQIGLSTLDIFTGHGVQSYVVLDEMCYDTKLLKRWTTTLLRKGIKIDAALVDAARVLRMPFSFNCKSFDEKNKHYSKDEAVGIPTSVISKPYYYYTASDAFKRILTLPDIVPALEGENEEIIKDNELMKKEPVSRVAKEKMKVKREMSLLHIKETNQEEVKKAYEGLINVNKLPLPILKMLNSTPDGLRNKTMLFLVPYLKNSLGFTKEDIINILIIWGERCTPALTHSYIKKEVGRLLRNYNLNGAYGKYDADLAETFGYIDFKLQRENKVKLKNEVTNNLNEINDCSFKIFLALLNHKSLNNEKMNYSIEEICNIANISSQTFYRNIKILTTNSLLIKKTKINKRNKENYMYYINPYISDYAGFTLIERATLELMFLKLNDAEIKLYTLLCSMMYTKEEIWSGQKYLAKRMGKGQSAISKIIESLVTKGFVDKKTEKLGNVKSCSYNLNY